MLVDDYVVQEAEAFLGLYIVALDFVEVWRIGIVRTRVYLSSGEHNAALDGSAGACSADNSAVLVDLEHLVKELGPVEEILQAALVSSGEEDGSHAVQLGQHFRSVYRILGTENEVCVLASQGTEFGSLPFSGFKNLACKRNYQELAFFRASSLLDYLVQDRSDAVSAALYNQSAFSRYVFRKEFQLLSLVAFAGRKEKQ